MATTTSIDRGPPNMNTQGATAYPSKFLAIVLENDNRLTIEDYVKTVAEKVQAINITHVCRTFKNYVAIYLSTTELVEKLTNKHKTLMIKDQEVKLHKMMRPVSVITFHGVPPEMPDDILLMEIIHLGIKRFSPVLNMGAMLTSEEFSHILTDKRRVLVQLNDNQVIPQSLVITFDGLSYQIQLNIIQKFSGVFNVYGTDFIITISPDGQIKESISPLGLVQEQVKTEEPDWP